MAANDLKSGTWYWAGADQILSSLTNMVFVVLASRQLGVSGFGSVAVVQSVYFVLLTLSRSWLVEPALVGEGKNGSFGRMFGRVLMLGSVAGFVGTLAAIVLPWGELPLLVLVLPMPLLLAHDAVRAVSVLRDGARTAFRLDLGWLTLLAVAVFVGQPSSPSGLLLCWSGSGAASLLLGNGITFVRDVRESTHVHTWRDVGSSAHWNGFEQAVPLLAAQLTPASIAFASGLEAAGYFRAGQALVAPLGTLLLFGRLYGLPVALQRGSGRSLRLIGMGLVSVAVLWGIGLLMVPTGLGERLLGSVWVGAKMVAVVLCVNRAILALVLPRQIHLRSKGLSHLSAKAWVVPSVGMVVAILVLGGSLGALGAAWILVVAAAGYAALLAFSDRVYEGTPTDV